MTQPEKLIGTHYSPWTEKARWALDAAGASCEFIPHTAMVGELRLRWLTRHWTGVVTAPAYLHASGALLDSFAIASHAGQREQGAFLFPEAHRAALAQWNGRSEHALAAGRRRALERFARPRGPRRVCSRSNASASAGRPGSLDRNALRVA